MNPVTNQSDESTVKVFIRARPYTENSSTQSPENSSLTTTNAISNILLDEAKNIVYIPKLDRKNQSEFYFEKVFGGGKSQADVYNECGMVSMVDDLIEGIDGCIMSYGQTGSGKTYTMYGSGWDEDVSNSKNDTDPTIPASLESNKINDSDNSDPFLEDFKAGIVPRILCELFRKLDFKSSESKSFDYSIHCQLMQIYNEKIYDLVLDKKRENPLQIREPSRSLASSSSQLSNGIHTGNAIHVKGMSNFRIYSKDEAFELLKNALKHRVTRATDYNQESSRSHTILQLFLTVQQQQLRPSIGDPDIGEVNIWRRATLNLVDLAGSEKWRPSLNQTQMSPSTNNGTNSSSTTILQQPDVQRELKEMTNINTSLHVLGNVVSALIEPGRKHIPYRDSVLTRVLQESLSGHGRVVLIATIQTSSTHRDETYSTLQFANRASNIKVVLSANSGINESLNLEAAQKQIKLLRSKLLQMSKLNGLVSSSLGNTASEVYCNKCKVLIDPSLTGNNSSDDVDMLRLKEENEHLKSILNRKNIQYSSRDEDKGRINSIINKYSEMESTVINMKGSPAPSRTMEGRSHGNNSGCNSINSQHSSVADTEDDDSKYESRQPSSQRIESRKGVRNAKVRSVKSRKSANRRSELSGGSEEGMHKTESSSQLGNTPNQTNALASDLLDRVKSTVMEIPASSTNSIGYSKEMHSHRSSPAILPPSKSSSNANPSEGDLKDDSRLSSLQTTPDPVKRLRVTDSPALSVMSNRSLRPLQKSEDLQPSVNRMHLMESRQQVDQIPFKTCQRHGVDQCVLCSLVSNERKHAAVPMQNSAVLTHSASKSIQTRTGQMPHQQGFESSAARSMKATNYSNNSQYSANASSQHEDGQLYGEKVTTSDWPQHPVMSKYRESKANPHDADADPVYRSQRIQIRDVPTQLNSSINSYTSNYTLESSPDQSIMSSSKYGSHIYPSHLDSEPCAIHKVTACLLCILRSSNNSTESMPMRGNPSKQKNDQLGNTDVIRQHSNPPHGYPPHQMNSNSYLHPRHSPGVPMVQNHLTGGQQVGSTLPTHYNASISPITTLQTPISMLPVNNRAIHKKINRIHKTESTNPYDDLQSEGSTELGYSFNATSTISSNLPHHHMKPSSRVTNIKAIPRIRDRYDDPQPSDELQQTRNPSLIEVRRGSALEQDDPISNDNPIAYHHPTPYHPSGQRNDGYNHLVDQRDEVHGEDDDDDDDDDEERDYVPKAIPLYQGEGETMQKPKKSANRKKKSKASSHQLLQPLNVKDKPSTTGSLKDYPEPNLADYHAPMRSVTNHQHSVPVRDDRDGRESAKRLDALKQSNYPDIKPKATAALKKKKKQK